MVQNPIIQNRMQGEDAVSDTKILIMESRKNQFHIEEK